MVCQYAPQPQVRTTRFLPIFPTRYRTTWQRVPVTCYRPTLSRDPVTGCPVTAMQPCVTYRWQPQRVPATGLRGFCSSLFGRPTVTANYVTPGVTSPMPAVSYGSSSLCGPSSCSPAVVPGPVTGAPSLAPSLQTVPPMSGTPGTLQTIPPTTLAPGTTTSPGTTTIPNGSSSGEAADTRPKLDPIPATETGGLNHVPRRRTDRLYDDVPGNHDVMPIPDPDAEMETETDMPGLVPPYVNPEDRTASRLLPYRWAATKISWPVRETEAEPAPLAKMTRPSPAPATPPVKRWDDSGWHSINP